MSKNDDRILELKKQVENKKKEMAKKNIKFVPETNLIIEINGQKMNINVLSEKDLKSLLVILNMYRISAADLEMNDFEISGYKVDQWINDVKAKINMKTLKREETELKELESKLDKLLSDDKKTELELDSIAALLN